MRKTIKVQKRYTVKINGTPVTVTAETFEQAAYLARKTYVYRRKNEGKPELEITSIELVGTKPYKPGKREYSSW